MTAPHYCPNCREPVTPEASGWHCDGCGWTDRDAVLAAQAEEDEKSDSDLRWEAAEYAAELRMDTEREYRG